MSKNVFFQVKIVISTIIGKTLKKLTFRVKRENNFFFIFITARRVEPRFPGLDDLVLIISTKISGDATVYTHTRYILMTTDGSGEFTFVRLRCLVSYSFGPGETRCKQ